MRILYIDIDTLRPDHIGAYGYHRATSPTLDAIAAQGARFTACHASDVPCLPSRTALFSGQFGARTGVVGHAGTAAHMKYPGDAHSTDPARLPLPMALSNGGLRTTTFSTFHQRHLAWHFCAGWDEIQRFTHDIGDEIATDLEGPARQWLTAHAAEEDWFLHLHFWDPHTPYRTPLEYGNPFADSPPPSFPSPDDLAAQQRGWGPTGAADVAQYLHGVRHPSALATPADYKEWIDGYDVGIRFADDAVGRLLDVLAAQGVLDECAVIVSSDHGENQGELNLYGSHLTADAITTRIPLIIRWPGTTSAGAVFDEPVYQLDLAPTLCDLAGVETPALWDGRSFAGLLTGQPYEPREYLVTGQGVWCVQRAVIADGYQYVRTLHPGLNPMPDEMLFDLRADPYEQVDLVEKEPETAGRLARLLGDWWTDNAVDAGQDPLLTVCREGGGYYVRAARDAYIGRLRATGRVAQAQELEGRRIAPVRDPFDLTRI